jgi:putative ABC transport system substrate-binding protein
MRVIGLAVVLAVSLVLAPLVTQGQQQPGKVYRIGVLSSGAALGDAAGSEPRNPILRAFLQGLRELGYVEGQNVVIERRFAEGMVERVPAIAAELARLKVDVIVAAGPALAGLKEARLAIPIVMAGSPDPVNAGLVTTLAHPGGNFTGMSLQHSDLDRKRFELLTQIVPGASRIAVLRGPDPDSEGNWKETQAAARILNRGVRSFKIRSPGEIDGVFRSATEWRAGAVVVIAGALIDREAQQVVERAAKYRLPAMYTFRNFFIEHGALISYGIDLVDIWRRAASYVDRILKGAKAADLPVEQPTKFELVINLKTARALGLTIPQTLLLRADQVIE